MEKLYQHTLKRQFEEGRQRTDRLEGKLDQVMDLLSKQQTQLALQPAAGAAAAMVPHQQVGVIGQQTQVGMIGQQQQAESIVNGDVNTININVFGNEQTGHIDRSAVKSLLDEVLSSTTDPAQGAISAFLKAAMLIYSDPSHPENLTCYLPNSKKDDVLVHAAAGWEVQPYTVVLPPMATKSVDALFENQPFTDAAKYGDLMKALDENERAYKEGKQMRTVLVRNKDLLKQALGSLPK